MTSQGFIERHKGNEISGQEGNRKLMHIRCQRQSHFVIPGFCGSDEKPVNKPISAQELVEFHKVFCKLTRKEQNTLSEP